MRLREVTSDEGYYLIEGAKFIRNEDACLDNLPRIILFVTSNSTHRIDHNSLGFPITR